MAVLPKDANVDAFWPMPWPGTITRRSRTPRLHMTKVRVGQQKQKKAK